MRPSSVRRGPFARMLPILGLTVFGGIGLILVLQLLGVIHLPFFRKSSDPNIGKVAVLVSNQPIPAYASITRDHLVLPETLEPSVVWLWPEEVSPKVINHGSRLIGRVLKKDKPKGYAFTEDDFLPENTRPGIVAGIPAGKRALALDADKLKGIYSLRAGDHFDLLAAVPIDDAKASQVVTTTHGKPAPPRKTRVQVLVQNGLVVVPARVRKPPEGQPPSKTPPDLKQPNAEIVIAASPEEISTLTATLVLQHEIITIARSGRPDDPGERSQTPDFVPPSPPPPPVRRTVEIITGSKRQTLVLTPAGAALPQPAAPLKVSRSETESPAVSEGRP